MTKTATPNWSSIGKWENGRIKSGTKTMTWISLLFTEGDKGLQAVELSSA